MECRSTKSCYVFICTEPYYIITIVKNNRMSCINYQSGAGYTLEGFFLILIISRLLKRTFHQDVFHTNFN